MSVHLIRPGHGGTWCDLWNAEVDRTEDVMLATCPLCLLQAWNKTAARLVEVNKLDGIEMTVRLVSKKL